MSRWVVMKFGGTSVTGADNWKTILSIVNRRLAEGEKVFIVCSAISKVSDRLERLAAAVKRQDSYQNDLNQLIELHKAQAREMELDADVVLGEIFTDLQRLFRGAALIQEVSSRLWARILSAGETLGETLLKFLFLPYRAPASWVAARHTNSRRFFWRSAK